MSKKWLLLAVAVVMAVALAACGGDPPDSGQDTPSPETGDTAVTGTVTDATMSSTTINTDDGTELAFSTDSSIMDMKDGLLVGDVVTITYTGEITDPTDTSETTVTKVTDGADNSTNPLRVNASSSGAVTDGDTDDSASDPAAVQ